MRTMENPLEVLFCLHLHLRQHLPPHHADCTAVTLGMLHRRNEPLILSMLLLTRRTDGQCCALPRGSVNQENMKSWMHQGWAPCLQ